MCVVCVQPILCNNQKKVWKLQGNLHHDTSLFQGRAWLQVGHPRRKHLSLGLTPLTYPNLPMVTVSGPYRSRRVSRGRAASWRTPRRCSASSAAGPTRRLSSTRRCVPTSSPGTTRASSPPGTAHDWPMKGGGSICSGWLSDQSLWHADGDVCSSSCNRVYQNTRAFLGHGASSPPVALSHIHIAASQVYF